MNKELIVWRVGTVIIGMILGFLIFTNQELKNTIRDQEKIIEMINTDKVKIDCEWYK